MTPALRAALDDRGVLVDRWIELGVLVVLALTLAPAASAGVVTKPF